MQKKNKNAKDNIVTLTLSINGVSRQISHIDTRKLELINYYIQQRTDNAAASEMMFEQLSAELAKGFEEELERQYKKYVPKNVRTVYEELLTKSEAFGTIIEKTRDVLKLDESAAAVGTAYVEKSQN